MPGALFKAMVVAMFVVCCGMYRAASTWQYQIAAELAEQYLDGRRIGVVNGENLNLVDYQNDRDCVRVLKCHRYHPVFAQLANSQQAIQIYSYRDIRDVVLSLSWKLATDIAGVIEDGFLPRAIDAYYQWIKLPGTLIQTYDQITRDPAFAIREIAQHLGVNIDAGMVQRLVKQYSKAANRARTQQLTEQLQASGVQLERPEHALAHDPLSLLHWNHLRDADQEGWFSQLTIQDILRIYPVVGQWLIDAQFEADDGWVFRGIRSKLSDQQSISKLDNDLALFDACQDFDANLVQAARAFYIERFYSQPLVDSVSAVEAPNAALVCSLPTLADDMVIQVKSVGKLYRIYDKPQDRLKDMIFWRFGRRYGHDFWALRNIDFSVRRGEMVGVIGRNGSGKSTLLQIVSGTLSPTEGEVMTRGRVAALLELGSGFNPEFTGRENVFLNGSILGLSREEMDARFDEIAAFADIGEFIDQPVKTYSSGMFVRLAFAVQTSVDPDILIVDEALAVGDVFFRQKCFQHIENLRKRGVAILFVSHAMMDVEQLCDRAILLEKGELLFEGHPSEVVRWYYFQNQLAHNVQDMSARLSEPLYVAGAQLTQLNAWPAADAFLNIAEVTQVSSGVARLTAMAVCDLKNRPCSIFQQGERARFYVEFELLAGCGPPIGGIVLHNDKGVIVHGKNTLQYDLAVPDAVGAGMRVRFQYEIELRLAPGEYTVQTGLSTMEPDDYARRGQLPHDELYAQISRLCQAVRVGRFAVSLPSHHMPVQLLHHGIADLPGQCHMGLWSA